MKTKIEKISIVHYWAGCPKSPNSKWQSFLAIVNHCRHSGWKNYLVWSRMPDNPELYEPFANEGCEIIIQRRSRSNFDLGSIWRTYTLLKRLKCNVFHCHNDHTSPLIGAALAGVPVRIWSKLSMSPYYEISQIPKGLHSFMLSTRISCFLAHKVLAISDKVRDELIDAVGYEKKIDTVYVPVNYVHFADTSDKNVKRELGIKSSSIVITTVGHAVPVKGWDIAIKAFAQVHQKIPDACLLLVGDSTSSKFQNQLARLIKELSLEDNVIFTGRRNDIPEILKASDIYIMPSRSEGLCLALIEAMASGLACIASNVGGVAEVITHKKDGLLFERENSKELANSIIKLIKNRKELKRLASRASIRSRDFSMETYSRNILEYYKILLNS